MNAHHAASRIRIHQIHKLPTPYTDFFFQALHDNRTIDLHVYHLWRGSWRRPWKSELGRGYHNTFMKPIWGIDWRLLKTAWCDVDSLFIVGDWAHLPTVAVILARCLRRAPVAIGTDTPQEDVKRPPVKKWLRRGFLQWVLPKVDSIFGTGVKAKRLLQEMGVNPGLIVDLPVFVDLGRPGLAAREQDIHHKAQRLRETLHCWPEGTVFSMAGTLVPRKGMDIGLRAFGRCRQGSPKPVGLLIAGEGPERQNLEALANSLELGNSVSFLGWQEPQGMEAVYLASDILLHPARSDPFPGVILEAMSWSRVVVGSDVCGNVEDRIISGVNGYAFASENEDELARIMLDLVHHPSRLPEIGARARKAAETWPVERGVAIVVEQAVKILTARRKRCAF